VTVSATAPSSVRDVLKGYLALTKPRIIELLLVTTVPTMIVAANGFPRAWLIVATLIGGTLAAGGANAFNMVIDRDIDAIMERTKRRPLVTGVMSARSAALFAFALELLAFVILVVWVNPLSAWLAMSATAFYVVVYTLILKRRSKQNIVIGGAAGALPPVVGYAVATGSVTFDSLILFAIIFMWTPPHFWALALVKSGDYARAGVPMMPNVKGANRTRLEILTYTLILIPLGILPWRMGVGGELYAAMAIVAGAGMAWMALRVFRIREGALANKAAMQLFGFSILYLFLLFSALIVEHSFGLLERFGL